MKVLFPKIKGKLAVKIYSDASFQNLPDQVSSGRGHVIFLTGDDNLAATLAWNSNKVKRVVGSTIAAEALSLQAAISHGFYLKEILIEIQGVDKEDIPIKAYTDSRNLYEAVYLTKLVEDKKLRCDIAQIQENIQVENVDLMLADCLTKQGVNSDKLMRTMKTGKIAN